MNKRIGLLALWGMLGGCGGPSITVGGKTLAITAQVYNTDDYFCGNLANGQFQIVLSDNGNLCDQTKADGGAIAFHPSDRESSNLRFIFPSLLRVQGNSFKVGRSDCSTSTDPPDTVAIAVFSHSPKGGGAYDVQVQATSGTITVAYADYQRTAGRIKGAYDLTFDSHITGTFDATLCSSLAPGQGR